VAELSAAKRVERDCAESELNDERVEERPEAKAA